MICKKKQIHHYLKTSNFKKREREKLPLPL